MLETDSPSKTFIGVRFVLFGFDPVNKTKLKSKLVGGGGIDAGQYSEDCTHVIVDNIVFDDPVCAGARNDGKTVVTGLWVDHSLDIGMPADATSIMYRPLRDLNGIPGAKNLIICLTGYQRQDRDDIMTMVGLMGAQFSKPLVANKVTHLICYKFEGAIFISTHHHGLLSYAHYHLPIAEILKYVLANKIKKIKLVNHPSPEDNYSKSKRLEDEVEGTSVMQPSYENANKSPQSLQVGTFKAVNAQNGEVQKISHNLSGPEGVSSVVNAKDILVTPGKRSRDDHASCFDNICVSEVPGHLDAGGIKGATSNALPDTQGRTPISTRTSDHLEFISRSVERPSHSDAKYSTTSYTRNTPRISPSSIFSGNSGNIRGSPKVLLGESVNMSSAKAEYAKDITSPSCAEIPRKGVELLYEEAPGSKKQKTDVSCSSSKSQKMNHDAQAYITGKPTALVDGLSRINNHSPLGNNGHSVHDMIGMNALQNPHANFSTAKSLKFRRNSFTKDHVFLENMILGTGENENTNKNTPQPSFSDLTKDNLVRGPDSGGFATERSEQVVAEAGELQDWQQNGGDPCTHEKGLETDKSCMHSDLNKMIAKKTLGNRPKLTSNVNQKGSIYLNVTASQNDPTVGMAKGKGRLETSPATVNVAEAQEMETESATKLGDNLGDNAVDKIGFTDDETEAPEEKDEDNYAANMRDGPAERKNAIEIQKRDRSTLKEGFVIGKGSRGKKQSPGKTKTTAVTLVVKEAESKKVLDVEENLNGKKIEENAAEKESTEPCPAGQAKSRTKENKPTVEGDQYASIDDEHVGETAANASKTPMKFNQKVKKSNSGFTPGKEVTKQLKTELQWFILSGHRMQRKEYQQVIRRLKGKFCRDSHQWSYQATHFIAPDPIRRTEKFFAAAASGRWILRSDYLAASSQAGRFLAEESYEWHKNSLSEDGTINLEAPRKWRLLRERTGHGAFYGMHIIIYGECVTPPLDTLKRVVKAGDGTILATSPPYTRFLTSGVDYAIVSPGISRADMWVQEFLRHKIPCIVADYLVEYVCKPGYSLDKHVLYNTNDWAEKSFSNLLSKAEEIVEDSDSGDDIACEVCGSRDRGEVMLICSDESGSVGCGVGMHMDCCDPPLESIPEEDWFCPKCSGSRGQDIANWLEICIICYQWTTHHYDLFQLTCILISEYFSMSIFELHETTLKSFASMETPINLKVHNLSGSGLF
ncbi:BRCT domain-containing protein [Salix suchowensis]|nr:BRCT domain-containing protein [Salix suchowensis]